MKESFITRVVHTDSICTFEVAGPILFALRVGAEFKKVEPEPAARFGRARRRASRRAGWRDEGDAIASGRPARMSFIRLSMESASRRRSAARNERSGVPDSGVGVPGSGFRTR